MALSLTMLLAVAPSSSSLHSLRKNRSNKKKKKTMDCLSIIRQKCVRSAWRSNGAPIVRMAQTYGSHDVNTAAAGSRDPWSDDSFDDKAPESFTTDDSASIDSNDSNKPVPLPSAISQPRTCRDYTTFSILCLINLLNYMDRYTISGVLTDIQKFYEINDAMAGLLQTVFIATFVVISPICGYLGDRYNRKWIMAVGIFIWVAAVFGSTFIPKDAFWAFMTCRAIVGIGEASYAVICPSLIADMFHGIQRSRMLMVFYFAIPVGSGLGFIVGSAVSAATGQWQWGLRVTAIAGIICLLLIIIFVQERPRGQMEVDNTDQLGSLSEGYLKDVWALCKNPTFITSTLAYTCVVFVVGTLAWWVPSSMQYAEADRQNLTSISDLENPGQSTIVFGFITTISGFAGVSIGTLGSNMMNKGTWCCKFIRTERSDPIVCAIGALIGLPCLFFVIQTIPTSPVASYIWMFFAITGLCFNWATNVDMLMSVVVPGRRSTANAIQILTSHLLGDGSGPYIIGAISDAIRVNLPDPDSPNAHWTSLADSFYIPNAILIPGIILYVVSALTYMRDRRKFQEEMGQLPDLGIEKSKINSAYSSEETSKI
ncbi:hypothetical protein PFISCL1PPCAC_2494 [Pristionchus fissidentatus]|uniref:Major facilitator superfamily (MFS) profile domain-containing protein n=1 Tax=Pristionchus fissidentatus TaxID=1538716 RepID=A0AAV5UV93_9BILA|nr:hypothetical protein PFISCL1PPCAC_2494 [Pristionchus fissidentatus]